MVPTYGSLYDNRALAYYEARRFEIAYGGTYVVQSLVRGDHTVYRAKRLFDVERFIETATGRVTTGEPNLQGIPVRTKEGSAIRAAFVKTKVE